MTTESHVGLALMKPSPGYGDGGALTALIQQAVASAGYAFCSLRGAFAEIVQPGAHVLLKPNWVFHYNKSGHGMDCMVTHPALIEAVVKELLRAQPGSITIADAPIQSCQFDVLVPSSWVRSLQMLSDSCPITIRDLRRTIYVVDRGGAHAQRDLWPVSDYLLFDLGTSSMLEPISLPPGLFRNTNYDPRELAHTHYPGVHKYSLWKGAFTTDVIINLPKLKTHRKAGITGALKNLVGLNGDKDYLPHHRAGGSASGGDCYAGRKPLKRLAEYLIDRTNMRLNKAGYIWLQNLTLLVTALCRVTHRQRTLEGEWYGNDTSWRMVLDLNRLVHYGNDSGAIEAHAPRAIYSLSDGIIAGEGFGPLAPEPVALGAVTFASSSAFAELAHCALLHLDWQKLPLIREAFAEHTYPLVTQAPAQLVVNYNHQQLSWEETARTYGKPFRPPRGWVGHIEWNDKAGGARR